MRTQWLHARVVGCSLVVVLGTLLIPTSALARDLEPGGNVALPGTDGGPGPRSTEYELFTPFEIETSNGALLFAGELWDRVTRVDATGTLSFERRVVSQPGRGSLNGIVVELACSDYEGFLTDVDYDPLSGGSAAPDQATRSANGAGVAFVFTRSPVFYGTDSKTLYALTEALEFVRDGKCRVTLQSGEGVNLQAAMPVRFSEPGCRPVDFDDLADQTIFPHGASFVSNGVLMHVEDFFHNLGACGTPYTSGAAYVRDTDDACGAVRELWATNVNIRFDYGEPLLGLIVHFGEYGGNINLSVNGQCVSAANMSDLPPFVGGVAVIVDEATPGQGCGKLALQGPIFDVSVGGQEFVIDDIECEPDVCFDDNAPPIAELFDPPNETCVCDPVEIYGTATDENFDHYLLEYRRTTDPSWTTIEFGTAPVEADLLGVWNAAGLPQGRYLIRLTVHDACGHSATAVNIVWLGTEFDTLTVREPDNGDVVGRRVCVDGTAWDNYCFDRYFVEYLPAGGTGWNPVDPLQPVYTSTVINDPIAHWDTDDLGLPDGDYELRARGLDDCGNHAVEMREVIVDNTWPVAEITSPQPCDCVEDAVEIFGIASDANLSSWTLQYTGGDASSWVTIANGTTNVVGGLLGIWDTTTLRPCAYTLRLVVVDAAVLDCNSAIRHRSEVTVSVNVGPCVDFDADRDGDVDLHDYYWFEQAFTGPLP